MTDLRLPDLSRYRDATRHFPYVVTVDSGQDGPVVLITALTHGNEIAGAVALDRLVQRMPAPSFGRVHLCFVNYRAYQTFDPGQPLAARFLQRDMNRLWHADLADDRDSSWETARAQALLPLVESADFLLDLHSMTRPAPPLALVGEALRHRDLLQAMGWPAWVFVDPGHADGKRLIDYRHFTDAGRYASAVLLECGAHDDPAAVEAGLTGCLRLLGALHMIEPPGPEADSAPQQRIAVTHALTPEHAAQFSFEAPLSGLEIIPAAGTLVARDGEREIRTPYDDCLVLMPTLLPIPNATALRFGRAEPLDPIRTP